jgi:hypothetical protein
MAGSAARSRPPDRTRRRVVPGKQETAGLLGAGHNVWTRKHLDRTGDFRAAGVSRVTVASSPPRAERRCGESTAWARRRRGPVRRVSGAPGGPASRPAHVMPASGQADPLAES